MRSIKLVKTCQKLKDSRQGLKNCFLFFHSVKNLYETYARWPRLGMPDCKARVHGAVDKFVLITDKLRLSPYFSGCIEAG